jgi:hypothetical protein
MSLISLEDFNQQALAKAFKRAQDPLLNGIECPQCGKELRDEDPNMQMLSNPPQTHVRCTCGFRGNRFV